MRCFLFSRSLVRRLTAGPPRLERGTSVLETDVLPLKLQAHLVTSKY